jgi:hypothetical protein
VIDHLLILLDITVFFNYSFILVIIEACVFHGAKTCMPPRERTQTQIIKFKNV